MQGEKETKRLVQSWFAARYAAARRAAAGAGTEKGVEIYEW